VSSNDAVRGDRHLARRLIADCRHHARARLTPLATARPTGGECRTLIEAPALLCPF
jgi:hypothetical protein